MFSRHGLAIIVAAWGLGCANTTTFQTNPRGARIYVNGEPCGESPCKYDTRYGFPDRIRVQIEKAGYEPAELFLDTEPPIATYALLGFGSYLFHTFEEEYRFDLQPTPSKPKPTAAPPPPATTTTATTLGPTDDLTDPEVAMAMASRSEMGLADGQGDCQALVKPLERPTLASAMAHFGELATVRKGVTCERAAAQDVYACEAELIGEDFAAYVRFFATSNGSFAPRCFVARTGPR
jgi:hypothetical protein